MTEEGHKSSQGNGKHEGGDHHEHMVADFRIRFWISLGATVPIMALSPMIQSFLGFKQSLGFSGDIYALWALSSFVFIYGGWPFLKGLFDELQKKQPGMMTLIAVAIATAYGYSSVVVFGLNGDYLSPCPGTCRTACGRRFHGAFRQKRPSHPGQGRL